MLRVPIPGLICIPVTALLALQEFPQIGRSAPILRQLRSLHRLADSYPSEHIKTVKDIVQHVLTSFLGGVLLRHGETPFFGTKGSGVLPLPRRLLVTSG